MIGIHDCRSISVKYVDYFVYVSYDLDSKTWSVIEPASDSKVTQHHLHYLQSISHLEHLYDTNYRKRLKYAT